MSFLFVCPAIFAQSTSFKQGVASGSYRQYVDEQGVLTLTNVPHKVNRRAGLTEVPIHFERITIPSKYKSMSRTGKYAPDDLKGLVSQHARLYGLSESLLYAIIEAESNFNPKAVSRAGARGLMQLMPATAEEMGVTDAFDPAQNIAGGTQYIAKLLQLFKGNEAWALAGYNAGPANVTRYNGIPPFAETQAYVKKVQSLAREYNGGRRTSKGVWANPARRNKFMVLSAAPVEKKKYTVHLMSGNTQQADEVVDKEPYYYIEYGRSVFPLRKELVKKIEKNV